jgi:formylglycine-generating enzyme required for sulfatase activity
MNAENPTQLEKSIRFYYSFRVGRGGSWDYLAGRARASYRNDFDPSRRRVNRLGFRLVRNK